MGEVVNLNQYRKQRDRLERKKTAAANRARFGRTKGETLKARREREREEAELDGKRAERPAKPDDAPEAG